MAAVDVDSLKEGSIAAFFELFYNVRPPVPEPASWSTSSAAATVAHCRPAA